MHCTFLNFVFCCPFNCEKLSTKPFIYLTTPPGVSRAIGEKRSTEIKTNDKTGLSNTHQDCGKDAEVDEERLLTPSKPQATYLYTRKQVRENDAVNKDSIRDSLYV